MFLFKKIVAPFFFPLSVCLELLLFGLVFLLFTRRQRIGKIFLSIGVVLLIALCYGAIADIFLEPLEYKYRPLKDISSFSDVKWVVVLGGGHTSDPRLPATGQISGSSLVRLVEGIRIYKNLPESKLILSGGAVFDPSPVARVMADVALTLGVEAKDLILEIESRDTEEEALLLREIVRDDRLILVTSASHIPRSMLYFKKLGMRPIPAPTDYLVKESQGMHPGMFFPGTGGLVKMQQALYEYLGLAWAKLRGKI